MSVSNRPSKPRVKVNEEYYYDVQVTNTSQSTGLTKVVLTDFYNLQSPNPQCVVYVSANHASCQAANTTPPSVVCEINQVLPVNGSLTVRFTFQAAVACTAQQNANIAYAVGYDGAQQSATVSAEALVPIDANDGRVPDHDEVVLQDVIITNAGARVTWRYNGQSGQAQSNPVSNPANYKQLYLPLIIRRTP